MRPEGVIAKWLSMPWALQPRYFDVGLQRLMSIDVSPRQAARLQDFAAGVQVRVEGPREGTASQAARGAEEERRSAAGYYLLPGTAIGILPVSGVLMKEVPPCYGFLTGERAASTEFLRMAVEAMLDDEAVQTVVLEIDSPGGQVAGTQELADAIAAAAEEKRVVAAVRDLAASGAYWLAAQASEISANRTAAIGSIGVYMVVDDLSRALANLGITTHVISSGGVKGAGVPGAPVSDEAIAVWREEVVALKDLFVAAVASGRGMPASVVDELATGRVWLADEAKELGLVDRVENFDDTLARLSRG